MQISIVPRTNSVLGYTLKLPLDTKLYTNEQVRLVFLDLQLLFVLDVTGSTASLDIALVTLKPYELLTTSHHRETNQENQTCYSRGVTFKLKRVEFKVSQILPLWFLT